MPIKNSTFKQGDSNIPMYSKNNEHLVVLNDGSPEGIAMSDDNGVRYEIPTFDEFIQNLKSNDLIGYPYNPYWKDFSPNNKNNLKINFQRAKNYILSYIQSQGYKSRQTILDGQKRAYNRVKPTYVTTEQGTKNARYISSDNSVRADIDSNWSDQFGGMQYVMGHELGHAADVGQRNKTFKKKYKGLNSHDSKDTETYADLMAFRLALYRSGIYDSRSTKKFTEKEYKRFLNSGVYNDSKVKLNEDYKKSVLPTQKDVFNPSGNYVRLLQQFPKDAVIEMMNTIAYNSNINKDIYMVKNGNKLINRSYDDIP